MSDEKINTPEQLIAENNRLWSVLNCAIENLSLCVCQMCGHLHMQGHICYECGFEPSPPGEWEKARHE